jgi:peptide/nickel transport system permease protein
MSTIVAGTENVVGRTVSRGWRDVLRRLWAGWEGRLGLCGLGFFIVMAVVGKAVLGEIPTGTTAASVYQSPSSTNLLGTDQLGRDVLRELIAGAYVSLVVGIGATAISVVVGTLIGLIGGFVRGRTDGLLMGLTDIMLTVPQLPLLIVLAAVVGQGLNQMVLVLGITGWATTTRLIRSEILSLRERTFVLRARAVGISPWRIVSVHLLPHVLPLVIANTVLITAIAILNQATLSFLGLGDPTVPSWGLMLQEGFTSGAAGRGAFWYLAPPGLCILGLVLSFTLIGHALTSALSLKDRTAG